MLCLLTCNGFNSEEDFMTCFFSWIDFHAVKYKKLYFLWTNFITSSENCTSPKMLFIFCKDIVSYTGPLRNSIREGPLLSCSSLYSQHLKQRLVHSKCSSYIHCKSSAWRSHSWQFCCPCCYITPKSMKNEAKNYFLFERWSRNIVPTGADWPFRGSYLRGEM